MLQYFDLNQKPADFLRMPEEGTVIYSLEFQVSPFPMRYQGITKEQVIIYLKKLISMMHEDAFVVFNGILIYKNDINLDI